MGVFTPTVPIVPGSDYYDEAAARFRDRLEDPAGSFRDQLQQGTTGPAPAVVVTDDGVAQIESPEGFEGLNNAIVTGLGGDPLTFERFNEQQAEEGTTLFEQVRGLAIVGAVFAVLLVFLNALVTGFGQGLAR